MSEFANYTCLETTLKGVFLRVSTNDSRSTITFVLEGAGFEFRFKLLPEQTEELKRLMIRAVEDKRVDQLRALLDEVEERLSGVSDSRHTESPSEYLARLDRLKEESMRAKETSSALEAELPE